MALLWLEGFDYYQATADIQKKWITSPNGIGSFSVFEDPGRNQGIALRFYGNSLQVPAFSPHATWVIGFGFKPYNITTGAMPVLRIRDGSTVQIELQFDGLNKKFSIYRDTTLLGTGTKVFQNGFWYHVELKVTIDNTAGTAKLKINEVTDIDLSSVDTQTSGNATANIIEWKTLFNGEAYCLDDIFICNGATTTVHGGGTLANNDFLGDLIVETIRPNDRGQITQWESNTGDENFYLVQYFDGDTTYVSSDAANEKDTYRVTSLLRITGNVRGVMVNTAIRKSDSVVRRFRHIVRTTGGEFACPSNLIPDTAYQYISELRELDPTYGGISNVQWTTTNINAAEFGFESL